MARGPVQPGGDPNSSMVGTQADELSLLIDGAHGYAIYMLDPSGHVTIWNKGAERLKGWSEAEVLGRHTSLFYPSDQVEEGKPVADLLAARAQGKLEEEAWRMRKDGSEFLAHITITALYDRLNAVTTQLEKLVTSLNQGQGTMGKLMQDQQLYENLNKTVTEMHALLVDIRKDPRKFLNLKVGIF